MFGSRRNKSPVIPEEEWNFAEVLDFDAETCLRYEFAREVAAPESYFSFFDASGKAPFPLEPWPLLPQQDREASLVFKTQRATLLVRPFDIADEGQKFASREIFPGLYFLHQDGSCRAYPPDLLEKPWLALDEGWRANFQEYTGQFLAGFSSFPLSALRQMEDKTRDTSKSVPRPVQQWGVFAARIDWRKSDSLLVAEFASWLQRERPRNVQSAASVGGRHSIYDSLNALSALRLRHRLCIEDAMAHTKTVLRKPLYRDRSSWDRAQRRAIQLFNNEFPGADSPKSESTISNRKA